MQNFEEFSCASQELDSLAIEGFFGEDSRNLVLKREETEMNEYMYECLLSIFQSNQYGIENIGGLTFTFIDMFNSSLNVNSQLTVDILAAVFKGTIENPEMETMSSYGEFLRLHTEWKNYCRLINSKGNATDSEKKKMASDLLASYSKGVELVSKMLGVLNGVLQVSENEESDLLENYFLTTYKKIEMFKRLTKGKYQKVAEIIDRDIRNSDAHSNIYYSVKESVFVMKKQVGKGKKRRMERVKIKPEKIGIEIYPKIGWFVQGFISACMLVILAFQDKELYKKSVKMVIESSSSS